MISPHVKLDSEDDTHFHLSDGHGAFKVAKKSLRPETLKKLQTHFAKGGEVGPLSDQVVDGVMDPGMSYGQPAATSSMFGRIKNAVGGALSGIGRHIDTSDSEYPSGPPLITFGAPDFSGSSDQTNQPAAPEAPAAAEPVKHNGVPADAGNTDQFAMPIAPAPAPRRAGVGGTPGEDKAINAAYDKADKAAGENAQHEADRLAAIAASEDVKNTNIQKSAEDIAQQYKTNLDATEKARQDAAKGIDPDRFWRNTPLAGKIAGGIGMILGGIGAGLTGGPNQALGVIQSAIDRDVEAQKANLQSKQNLVRTYMEQGHDIQEAGKLATAHYQAVAEGQIAAANAKFGGMEAGPAGQMAQAELAQKRIGALQEVHRNKLDNAIKNETLIHEQNVNAMSGNQAALMPLVNNIRMKQITGQGLDDREYALGSFAGAIDPKDDIKLDDGKHYSAGDPEEMKKLKDSNASVGGLKSAIRSAMQLREKNKGGTFGPQDSEAAKNLQNEMISKLEELGTKMPTMRPNTIEEMKKLALDASGHYLGGKFEGSMQSLAERAEREWTAQAKARLRNRGGLK